MAEGGALDHQRIKLICSDLQIPPNYGALRGLRLFPESVELVTVDESDPTKRLAPEAAEQWLEMKRAAVGDGIKLILISGFRGFNLQRELIQNNLKMAHHTPQVFHPSQPP